MSSSQASDESPQVGEQSSETETLVLDIEQVFSLPEQDKIVSYDATLIDRIMLRYVESYRDNPGRKKRIDKLVRGVKAERDDLYEKGFVDGTGLLYQLTPSYQELLGFCTDKELVDVHEAIVPGWTYKKMKRSPTFKNDRKERIDKLVLKVEAELDDLYELGAVDGTGLLYQSTSTYDKLMFFCTDEELVYIHKCIIPAAPYKKRSWPPAAAR